jgi:uncharacterized protein (DUF885 family)
MSPKRSEVALGPKFDQQRFHGFILAHGLLPADLLRRAVVDDFIPAERASTAAKTGQ